jgi:chromosome partitioning protein
MAELADCDVIVIDTPGSDTGLSRIGHARADILITPLNDSFLDLDLLARLDRAGKQIKGPSIYAEAVWEQRKRRALADGGSIDWVVMRNRLSSLDARNKRDIGRLLEQLAKRIGFRLAPGFSERVIFRELFPRGLTLLDLNEGRGGPALNMSHVAARQEVRALLQAIGIAELAER